ncbi:MAG: hypothetical protein Q8S21_01420 [Candidatus Paracaedibacteraceae bacterium]|nr:hypothetical protein [Candidatus Paracaedibacteraceae bacterium]
MPKNFVAEPTKNSVAASNNVLATAITFYKDGALIRQGQILPLIKGKHPAHSTGIASSIVYESLMLSLSALPKEASIEEVTVEKAEEENTMALSLTVNSTVAEPKNYVNITYLLRNMSWKPYYAIQFTSGYQELIFNGWIDIVNKTGIALKNAQIQFVDGNIPPIQGDAADKAQGKAKGYAYKGILDMKKNETKRINWVFSGALKAKQDYRIFVGGKFLKDMESKAANPIVETWVSFRNVTENALGQDLPQGTAVLYYQDDNGHLEVLGNTSLPHMAAGQEVSVKIPSTQIDKIDKNNKKESKRIETELEQNQYRALSDLHMTESHYCLTLKNTSAEPVVIRVMLDLPFDVEHWEVIRETIQHEKTGETSIYWSVPVPANGSVQLKYQLRYIKAAE